jgi:hypothetical protein
MIERRRGSFGALGFGVALLLAGWHAALAADPPTAPAVLAKGISGAFLVGLDDRNVYWIEEAPGSGGAASVPVHRLRRVAKQGGAAETLTELHRDPEEMCGSAVGGGHAFFVVGGGGPFEPWQIVAVDTAKPGAPISIGKPRSDLCHLVVQGDRLSWEDEENDGGVWSAALDGSGPKQVWKTPEHSRVEQIAAHGRDLILLVWTMRSAAPSEGLGLGNMGRLGNDPSKWGDVLVIPPGGKAKSIWQGQLPSDVAADSSDVAVCTKRGIVRLAGGRAGSSSQATSTCKGEVRLWQGWYLQVESSPNEGAPLVARKVSAPEQAVQLAPRLSGGAKNLLLDRDAIYACAVGTKPEVCDLVRLPGPTSPAGDAKPAKP